MYVVWRKRPVIGEKRTVFLQDWDANSDSATPWKPLHCDHRGPGRVAWTPLVMHAERRDGKPLQKLLHRLPTIRSCCIADPFRRAAWWCDLEWNVEFWRKYSIRPLHAFSIHNKLAVIAKLREVVPSPTPSGVRDFREYRLAKEREHKARWDAIYERMDREAQRQQAEREAADGERQRREQGQREREDREREDVRSAFRRPGEPDCFAVLGLRPDATPKDIKARFRDMVKQHHPDRGGNSGEFIRVKAAYDQAMRKAAG